jgi:hypothetical protein
MSNWQQIAIYFCRRKNRKGEETTLLAFELWKNGERLATAGLTESGAMSLMLTWVAKGAGASAKLAAGADIDNLDLRLGGIDASDPTGEHSVEWVEDTALRLGDDITIKIVSANAVDAPARREPVSGLPAGEHGQRFVLCPTCGAVRLQPALQLAE